MGQLRLNGGLIGSQRRPSVSSASGVWCPAEHVVYARVLSWPGKSPIPALSPTLWYDFSDESTITLSNSRVSAVTDKGSRGWTLTKSTTGPIYTAPEAGINGLRCIDWGSSVHSNYLRNSNSVSTNIAEIYIVLDASFGSVFPSYNGLITGLGASAWNMTGSQAGTGTGFSGTFDGVYLNGSTNNVFTSGALPTINNPTLIHMMKTNATVVTIGDGVQIGMDRANSTRGWYGLMGEVIVFSTFLSDANRFTLRSFLASKWGLTLA